MKVHSPYPKPTRRCDSRAAGNVRYDVGPRARSVRTVRLGSALLLVSRRLGTRRTTDEQWDEKCDAASTFSLSSDNRTVGRQSLEIEQPAHSAPWSSGNIDEPPVRSPVSRAQKRGGPPERMRPRPGPIGSRCPRDVGGLPPSVLVGWLSTRLAPSPLPRPLRIHALGAGP